MILIKLFQTKITAESVVKVSENLKKIVDNETLSDTDIVLVTSVVEKITDSLNATKRNENQVSFFWICSCKLQIICICINKLRMEIFFCSYA